MGLTDSGKTLCYINNFGNGKNSVNGIELPYVELYRSSDYNYVSDLGSIYVRRSYLNPSYEMGSSDRMTYTNYQNIINSLNIIPYGKDEDFVQDMYYISDNDNKISVLYSASYNKENDEVNYENPIILHCTKTIKFNKNLRIKYISLWADNVIAEHEGRVWANDDTKIKLAEIEIDTVFNKDDIATFTITVG